MTTTDQHCWLSKLICFQFEIIYKPRAENKVANALSRIEEDQELNVAISSPYWLDFAKVKEEIHGDPTLVQLAESLKRDPTAKLEFLSLGGLLFYKGRLVLSQHSSLIAAILQEFHLTPIRGHSGFTHL